MTTTENRPAAGGGPAGVDDRESPYVGLRAYAEEDAWLFFGREQERDIVASNLVASRLTLLYAPTGVGKSSLLQAGVVPKLRAEAREQVDEDDDLPFYVFTFASWQDDPVAALIRRMARTLDDVYDRSPGSVDPAAPLSEALAGWTHALDADLFVILDQFEEYFLYRANDLADRFATEFPAAVNDTSLRVHFLISLTEDALAKLDVFKGTVPTLFRNYLRIDYLDRDSAEAAITGPLRAYNEQHLASPVDVEVALIDDVLDGAGVGKVAVGQVGAGTVESAPGPGEQQAIETAHLQMVMDRVWDEERRRGSRVLRAETLVALGGTDKIVRSHLDDELKSLSPGQQDIMARAFEQLVTPSGTKIAHTAADLADMANVPEPELVDVLNRLSTGGRRVLRDIGPARGQHEDRYQIFHDLLAPAILEWRARHEAEHERIEEEEALRREHAQNLTRVRRRAAIAIGVLVAISFAVIALLLFRSSQHEKQLADSRSAAARAAAELSVDPAKSLREALAAHPTRTREAEVALRRAVSASHLQSILSGHTDGVRAVAFDAGGDKVVTASDDGTARIWDARTGTTLHVLRGHTNLVVAASFDPSGQKVVTASQDGTARIWDTRTGRSLHELQHTNSVSTASFDRTGTMVATASADGTAGIWDVATGRRLQILGVAGEQASWAEFDRNGRWVVTGDSAGTVEVWNVQTGERIAAIKLHQGWVNRATFSPDGTTIATAGVDGRAYVWRWQDGSSEPTLLVPPSRQQVLDVEFGRTGDLVTAGPGKTAQVWTEAGQPVSTLTGHTAAVNVARFSPDGRSIVTASDDGTARVWDAGSGALLAELPGHTEWVRDVDVIGDGRGGLRIGTASSDGTARLWHLPGEVVLTGHTDEVWDAEYSRDGKMVVTSSPDGVARVWDATTGQLLHALPGHQGWAIASFGPDDRIVTVDQRTVRVWDRDGKLENLAFVGDDNYFLAAARFDPTGDVVYVADQGERIYRWNWQQAGATPNLLAGTASAFLSDFDLSPDGKQFVIASPDRTATIGDAETGDVLHVLRKHAGVINGVRFSRDGRWVVTAATDGTARLWDAHTGKLLRTFVAGTSLSAASVDPKTGRVVTGGSDGIVRVFSPDGELLAEVPAHADYINSVEFSPDGTHVLTASDDHTARIFDPCASCGSISTLVAKAERTRVASKQPPLPGSPDNLARGDCYDDARQQLGRVIVVGCSGNHDAEAFATLTYESPLGSPFPTQALHAYEARCTGRLFTDYVGERLKGSGYRVSTWPPDESTWKGGDRRIVCVLRSSDAHNKLSGSARGSR